MLAKLSPEEGLKALLEFETRVVAGRACCPSSGLADVIRALLEANAQCVSWLDGLLFPKGDLCLFFSCEKMKWDS